MPYGGYNPRQNNLIGVDVSNHSNRGLSLEKRVAASNSEYEARRWAKIDRNPSAWEYIGEKEYLELIKKEKDGITAVTGSGRKMKMVPTNVDFSGGARGRFLTHAVNIKFDAKMCKGDKIPLGNFKLHQVNNMIAAEKCGAVAGFLIQFWGRTEKVDEKTTKDLPDLYFFCPPMLVRDYFDRRAIRERAKNGEGAITTDVMKQKAITIPCHGNFIDWLPAVLPHAFEK
jgi:penicillin-binding protein-related factor A (putative recombinase)